MLNPSNRQSQPPADPRYLKEALFGLGLREVERPVVGVVGLTVPAGATQEAGTRGVKVSVVVEVEAVEDGQAGFGPVDLGHGDGPVHLDDRGAGLPGERLVQGGDLPPVAGLVQVQVRNGRLEQVGPGAPSCHGPLQQRSALVDMPCVPEVAVLVVEGDDLPVAKTLPPGSAAHPGQSGSGLPPGPLGQLPGQLLIRAHPAISGTGTGGFASFATLGSTVVLKVFPPQTAHPSVLS